MSIVTKVILLDPPSMVAGCLITITVQLCAAEYEDPCYWPRRPVTAQQLCPRLSPLLLALAVFRAHSKAWKHAKCWCRQQFCVSGKCTNNALSREVIFADPRSISSSSTPCDLLEILLLSTFRWREHPCVTRASMVKPYNSVHLFLNATSRLPEHPCPNHNSVHLLMSAITRASMPKP